MADDFPLLDPDTETPAVLGKTDALIAKHRGQGPDPQVPVLTDLAADSALGDIPVLTDIAPLVGDELMFTPEEIRAEGLQARAAATEIPVKAAPAAQSKLAANPPGQAEPNALDLLDLAPAPSPVAKPAPQPVAPAPTRATPALPEFDFPELTLPTAKAAPSPRPSPPPPPLPSGPLMPELALNFDFSPPPEDKAAPALVATPPTPAPTAAAAPALSLADDMLNELSIELPDEAFPVARPSIDPAQLAQDVLASLRPEVEKLLRAEMARQVAGLHAEALKRTLGALQPQLDKLVRTRIDEALKQR